MPAVAEQMRLPANLCYAPLPRQLHDPGQSDRDDRRPQTLDAPSLRVARPAADAGRDLLGGQHRRRPARRRPDLAVHADVPALGGGDGRAVADLRRAGARALAADQAAAAPASWCWRRSGFTGFNALYYVAAHYTTRHQHRHPAGLDADLRPGRRVHRARHPREPRAARRRARHGRRRGGGRHPRRAAGDPRGRAQQGRSGDAGGVRALCLLHGGAARPPGHAGNGLLHVAGAHRRRDVAAARRASRRSPATSRCRP